MDEMQNTIQGVPFFCLLTLNSSSGCNARVDTVPPTRPPKAFLLAATKSLLLSEDTNLIMLTFKFLVKLLKLYAEIGDLGEVKVPVEPVVDPAEVIVLGEVFGEYLADVALLGLP